MQGLKEEFRNWDDFREAKASQVWAPARGSRASRGAVTTSKTVKEKNQDTVWSLLNLVRASVDRSEIILYAFFALVFPSKVSQTFAP